MYLCSVMDMLRFHKFTIGHAWTTEFGSADCKEEFDWLIKSVSMLCLFIHYYFLIVLSNRLFRQVIPSCTDSREDFYRLDLFLCPFFSTALTRWLSDRKDRAPSTEVDM